MAPDIKTKQMWNMAVAPNMENFLEIVTAILNKNTSKFLWKPI
jgi:hypothetical protein